MDPKPQIKFDSNENWINKHGNVEITPERLYQVWNRLEDGSIPSSKKWKAGLNALRQIVIDTELAQKEARGVGGQWSLSGAAITPNYMLNTMPLNSIDIGFKETSLVGDWKSISDQVVFSQCGASIKELNLALAKKKLSLSTSGASNGQTIAGAVSTGTHGSTVKFGSMQDFIIGIHMVGEAGQHYWIEEASNPVVSQQFINSIGATLKQDDDLFRSALVSFGSFGLIHGLLLKAEPIYLLEVHRMFMSYNDVSSAINTLDVSHLNLPRGSELPHHFEININPYADPSENDSVAVTATYKLPYEDDHSRPNDPGLSTIPGADLMGIIGNVTELIPDLIPAAIKALFTSSIKTLNGEKWTLGEAYDTNKIFGKADSCEIGVDLNDAKQATEIIISTAKDYPFPGLIALRYVKQSNALLAFTKYPISCAIELPAAYSSRSIEFYKKVLTNFETQGISYTLHWGQYNDYLTLDKLKASYGDAVDKWIASRKAFLPTTGQKTFSNAMIRKFGLSD